MGRESERGAREANVEAEAAVEAGFNSQLLDSPGGGGDRDPGRWRRERI